MTTPMQQYFKDLVTGVEQKLAATGPNAPRARKRYTLEIARLGARLFSGEERIAWCGIAVPYDVLGAMGVTSCFAEFVGAMMAGTGAGGPIVESAEQLGYSTDSCAYHRAVLAAAQADMMPVPDFLIATSCPCSGGMGVIENLARHFGKDLFVIHVPADDHPAAIRYLADQYRAMVDFVAEHTGGPLAEDSLRTTLERTNRARAALAEAFDLAAHSPTPARQRDLVNVGIALPLLFGTEAGVVAAETYRDEFAAKLASPERPATREPVRLLWLQNRIQFKHPLDDLLGELGAAVVADELNVVTWEPLDLDDPYVSLAKRALSFPLMLPVARRVEHLRAMVEHWDIDGVINPCHWGCRQGTGSRGLIQEHLKQFDIPVLNLEVDCVDDRNFSAGQLRTRLEAFVEMLG